LIFALTAIAAAIAWRTAPDGRARASVLALFAINGCLNVLWSAFFFQLRRPDWAFYEVGFLWLSIFLLIIVLARWSKAAPILLLPYLAWVGFAAALNHAVVARNGPFCC
jgi:tryptophan-rich sensory protein